MENVNIKEKENKERNWRKDSKKGKNGQEQGYAKKSFLAYKKEWSITIATRKKVNYSLHKPMRYPTL